VKLIVYEQIEELRIQLQETALDKELTDPRVVSISEKLDLLINEFYIYISAKQRKKGVLDISKPSSY